jgi:hypothetical protein
VLKNFSITPPENSGGAENSTENLGPHAKNFFCSMYEMSQRHPVWVAENHINPCNSEGAADEVRDFILLSHKFLLLLSFSVLLELAGLFFLPCILVAAEGFIFLQV